MFGLNRFNETIFLKKDSNLEKDIEELKKIRDKVKDKEKIDLDIKKCEKGLIGERQIEYELSTNNIGMYVLHDVRLEYEDLSAQIDFIIITPVKIYIVECKELFGDIYVDETGQFTRVMEYNGNKKKESIYSPYTQVIKHIDLIKKRWYKKHDKLIDKLLYQKYLDNWYQPIVVFTNSKGILNVSKAPKEIKQTIIRVDQLNNYLKKELDKTDKSLLSNKKQMEETALSFLNIHTDKKIDRTSKYELIDDKEELMNKLKEYRIKKSKKMNVPAFYIFNNDELEKLIQLMPQNIEQLKKEKILEDIKIKCHGEEIIKILKGDNIDI